jgi:electron transfer flavoprotein beta subunit
MRIFVLIKQVPKDINISLNKDFTINREAGGKIINPADMSALMTAVDLKNRFGGEIYCLIMGPQSAVDCLREAAMYGADFLCHLCDPAFAGSDSYMTAQILAKAIVYMGGADLILCGRYAIDGETGQVGPELSVSLRFACLTHVIEVTDIEKEFLICTRITETANQIIKVKLPAVLSVWEYVINITLPSILMMRKAAGMPVRVINAKELNFEGLNGRNNSPTKVEKVYIKEHKRKETFFLSPEEGIGELVTSISVAKGTGDGL